jgi:hypothetical protein
VKGVALIHDLVRTGEKVIPIDSTLKSEEELVTAIATMHNVVRAGGEEAIPI